jgi:hypothetical protein
MKSAVIGKTLPETELRRTCGAAFVLEPFRRKLAKAAVLCCNSFLTFS